MASQVSLQKSLLTACDKGDLDTVDHLTRNVGVDVNIQNKEGEYVLYGAVLQGNHDIIKALLQRGAKVNERNGTQGLSLIHI